MLVLYVAVSAHGFGHLAQVAPVINGLRDGTPDLRVIIQGDLAPEFVRSRVGGSFELVNEAADVGVVMDGPLHVDWKSTNEAYRSFCRQSAEHLHRQTVLLENASPDLVLADIPWLPLVAAKRLGVPAAGICSLNWYDILIEGPVADGSIGSCLEQIRQAYLEAGIFLRPTPAMPMDWLPQVRDIGPLAIKGICRRTEILERLGLEDGTHLGLLQFGGVAGEVDLAAIPELVGLHWLVPQANPVQRSDFVRIPQDIAFTDVLASCDILFTKPGYNSFAEAAVNGVPVISAARNEWPEARWLVEWIAEQVPFRQLSADEWQTMVIGEAIQDLLQQPKVTPVEATGREDAVAILRSWLSS